MNGSSARETAGASAPAHGEEGARACGMGVLRSCGRHRSRVVDMPRADRPDGTGRNYPVVFAHFRASAHRTILVHCDAIPVSCAACAAIASSATYPGEWMHCSASACGAHACEGRRRESDRDAVRAAFGPDQPARRARSICVVDVLRDRIGDRFAQRAFAGHGRRVAAFVRTRHEAAPAVGMRESNPTLSKQ